MNITKQIIVAVVCLLIQVIILKNMSIQVWDRYAISIFIYPLIILFLPLGFNRYFLLLLAFGLGLFIDMFYDSPGVHAATLTLTAFTRTYVLRLIEPRGGFRTDNTPTAKNYSLAWTARFVLIMLGIHLFTYFSIDAFSYVFIDKIFINSLLSLVFSYISVLLIQFIANL